MKRRPPSLAFTIILSFSLVSTIGFLGFGWVTQASLKQHFAIEDNSELAIITRNIEKILSEDLDLPDRAPLFRRLRDILVGHHHALLKIVGDEGTLFSSPALADMNPPIDDAQTRVRLLDEQRRYRLLVSRIEVGTGDGARAYKVIVAVTFDYHRHFLRRFQETLWITVLVGIIACSLLGWIIVHQGLRPLHRIVAQIRHINAQELKERIDPDEVPKELRELVESFNAMIERIDDAFQRISNFSSEIAHELRTPITNMMTQTQVALSRARSLEEYRETLYSNIDEYERMARMVNDMLLLAKSDVGLDPAAICEVVLEDEGRDLIEFYEAWAEEAGVSLRLEGRGSVTGDPAMLRRALSNLVSNAIRHTPPGGEVCIRIQSGPGEVWVEVRNQGQTIPVEAQARLFDRFYHRPSPEGQEQRGFGLGLAIVKSIIDAHHGRIRVRSGGGYTSFLIALPVQGTGNSGLPHEAPPGRMTDCRPS